MANKRHYIASRGLVQPEPGVLPELLSHSGTRLPTAIATTLSWRAQWHRSATVGPACRNGKQGYNYEQQAC